MSLIKQGPWRPAILALGGLVLLVVAWQLGVMLLKLNMPIVGRFAPLPTLNSLIYLIGDAGIYGHIWASLQRVLVGLGLALLIGVPVGLLLGRSALAEQLSGGAFQLLRMISPLSWMPVVVMLFGIGDAPIYFLLTFAAVWPIILNTSAGVKSIDKQWLQLGASLSATP